VSSSAGVETGTIRLIEQMTKEVVRMQGGASKTGSNFTQPTVSKATPELQPKSTTQVSQSLALGKEERQFIKAPAVEDPRRFDAPLNGADVDAVVAAIRQRAGTDKPLTGKKVAVAVESLFNPTELREIAHTLGDLGAEVVYTSRLSFPGWDKSNPAWPGRGTFESAATPNSDKVHQLVVTTDLNDVQANIGQYAALIIPDGNGSKRLSYRPDGQPFEANPFFNVVAAAVGNPGTKVAVSGRGMWGLLGAATLPDSPLKGAVIAASPEMMPEAKAISDVVGGSIGGLQGRSPRTPMDREKGLLFNPYRENLALIEELADQLIAQK
jgi:putative intracellular protease/amidase